MESTRVHHVTPSQVVAAAAVPPVKQELFGSGKKAGVARNASRKALADKTNESPSAGVTLMMVKEGDRGSYKGTPYPKLHELHKAGAVPGAEEVLCDSQVRTFLHKLEMGEYGLQRIPSEFRTPGELAAPTPANTPINVPSSFTAFTPCLVIAPPVFEDKLDVSMSPDQQEEHEEEEEKEEEANANNKTNAGFPAESSSVQCVEKRVQAESTAQDGEILPLDLQLMYSSGKAASLPPSTEKEEKDTCLTEPNAPSVNVLQHPGKVMWNLEMIPGLCSRSDVSTVTTISSGWVGRDVEVGKHVDEDDDDDDDFSECSVVVNVSSPHLEERWAPSKFSMADNRTDNSLLVEQQHMNSSRKVKSYQEEGFGEYDYYTEDDEDEFEDVELDGDCDELCNAISQFTMKEKDSSGGLPVSTGQHVHFSYNSDDEIEAQVVDAEPPHQKGPDSTALHLKGLPTPKGKHLRFDEDIGSPSV